MEIVLFILVAFLIIVLLAFLLPLRVIATGAGGTDAGFTMDGKILFFAGLFGIGGEFHGKDCRIGCCIGSKRIFTVNVSRFTRRPEKKLNKDTSEQGEKTEFREREKPEPTTFGFDGKIRMMFRKIRRRRYFLKTVLHEIPLLFRMERCVAGVTLGLDNPALTGQAVGILHAVNGLLPGKCFIRPKADFTRRVFSGDFDIEIIFRTYLFWIHLMKILWPHGKLRRQKHPLYRENLEPQEA